MILFWQEELFEAGSGAVYEMERNHSHGNMFTFVCAFDPVNKA